MDLGQKALLPARQICPPMRPQIRPQIRLPNYQVYGPPGPQMQLSPLTPN